MSQANKLEAQKEFLVDAEKIMQNYVDQCAEDRIVFRDHIVSTGKLLLQEATSVELDASILTLSPSDFKWSSMMPCEWPPGTAPNSVWGNLKKYIKVEELANANIKACNNGFQDESGTGPIVYLACRKCHMSLQPTAGLSPGLSGRILISNYSSTWYCHFVIHTNHGN